MSYLIFDVEKNIRHGTDKGGHVGKIPGSKNSFHQGLFPVNQKPILISTKLDGLLIRLDRKILIDINWIRTQCCIALNGVQLEENIIFN